MALDRGPYFDTSATKNVTSLVGRTGSLNCRIRNLGNKTVCYKNIHSILLMIIFLHKVSWIRHRDLHLLTVSESTYTSDQRFSSIYNKQTGDWSLQVLSFFFKLNFVTARCHDTGVFPFAFLQINERDQLIKSLT